MGEILHTGAVEIATEEQIQEAMTFTESAFRKGSIHPDFFMAGVEMGQNAFIDDGLRCDDPFRVANAADAAIYKLDIQDGIPAFSFALGFGFGFKHEDHKKTDGETT